MPNGIPVNRQWIVVTLDGTLLLDWENGTGVDLLSGEFVDYQESEYSHPIQDDELEVLKRAGRVSSYDAQRVFVNSLPEMPERGTA